MAGVTISTTDVQRDFNLDWVDTVGAEHTTEPLPPGYSGVTWSADDEGLLVSLARAHRPGTCQPASVATGN
jgi:hypothetical protein